MKSYSQVLYANYSLLDYLSF